MADSPARYKTIQSATELRHELEAIAGDSSGKVDLSSYSLDGLELSGLSLVQSLLIGTLVANCKVSNCDFSRCDFDAARIENVLFESSSFESSDLRSATFFDCRFLNCSFDHSFLSDSSFDSCEFDHSSIRQAIWTNAIFTNCKVHETSLERSTVVHSNFRDTEFQQICFGDCTFKHIVFESCDLRDCAVNADSIGYIFGLSVEDLSKLRLIFLGDSQELPEIHEPLDLVKALVDSCEQRAWHLPALLLRVQFGPEAMFESFRRFAIAVSTSAAARLTPPLSIDDISFLIVILKELSKKQALSVAAVIDVSDAVATLSADGSTKRKDVVGSWRGSEAYTRSVAGFLRETQDLLLELLDRLQQSLGEIDDIEDLLLHEEIVSIRLLFRERPRNDTSDLLSAVTRLSGLHTQPQSHLIASGPGSYYEILSISIVSLVAIQIALFCFNGILIQVTEAKARIDTLRQKRSPRSYLELARSGNQSLPEVIRVALASYVKLRGNRLSVTREGLDEFASNVIGFEVVDQAADDERGVPSLEER